MYSFFSSAKDFFYNTDEVTIQFTIDSNGPFGTGNANFVCSSVDAYTAAYRFIENRIELRSKYATIFKFSIKLDGKLKDENIDQYFDSLSKFKEFLESKQLITKPITLINT